MVLVQLIILFPNLCLCLCVCVCLLLCCNFFTCFISVSSLVAFVGLINIKRAKIFSEFIRKHIKLFHCVVSFFFRYFCFEFCVFCLLFLIIMKLFPKNKANWSSAWISLYANNNLETKTVKLKTKQNVKTTVFSSTHTPT